MVEKFPDSLIHDGHLSAPKDSGSWLNPSEHLNFKFQSTGPRGEEKFPFAEEKTPVYRLYDPRGSVPMKDLRHVKSTVKVDQTVLFNASPSPIPDFRVVHHVCYQDDQNKQICGYVRASNLKNVENLEGPSLELSPLPGSMRGEGPLGGERPLPCGLKISIDGINKLCGPLNDLANPMKPEEKLVAENLGYCHKPNSNHFYSWKSGNLFDQYLKNGVDEKYTNAGLSEVKKDDGTTLTQSDFEDIDTLARTLLGEMETCEPKYMQAVARTVLNRAQQAEIDERGSLKKSLYVQPTNQYKVKGMISRVCLARSQYDAWDDTVRQTETSMKQIEGKMSKQLYPKIPDRGVSSRLTKKALREFQLSVNKAKEEERKTIQKGVRRRIEEMLCPKGNRTDVPAWNRAVKVAIDAVMHRRKFLESTSQMGPTALHESYKFYSSDTGQDSTRFVELKNIVHINVDPKTKTGDALDNPNCTRFWEIKH